MLNVEALRQELVIVADVVKEHKQVAEKAGVSTGYLRQIRSGENAKTDNEKNRALIKDFIGFYREIGRIQEKELKEVLENKVLA